MEAHPIWLKDGFDLYVAMAYEVLGNREAVLDRLERYASRANIISMAGPRLVTTFLNDTYGPNDLVSEPRYVNVLHTLQARKDMLVSRLELELPGLVAATASQ